MPSRIIKAGEGDGLELSAWPVPGERGLEAPHRAAPAGAGSPAAERPVADFEARLAAEREDARRRGEASGRQQARAELDDLMSRLAHSIETLAGQRGRCRCEAERDVVALAMAVARRVLRREVRMDGGALVGLVRAAFDAASLREITEVRLHPSLVPLLQPHMESIGAPESIVLRPDASLEAGAVLVETTRGTIDASVETQLDEIGRGFADLLPGGGGGA
jgi:flagellar assembly protein FliH